MMESLTKPLQHFSLVMQVHMVLSGDTEKVKPFFLYSNKYLLCMLQATLHYLQKYSTIYST